jgi:hypothetical protein
MNGMYIKVDREGIKTDDSEACSHFKDEAVFIATILRTPTQHFIGQAKPWNFELCFHVLVWIADLDFTAVLLYWATKNSYHSIHASCDIITPSSKAV